MHCAPESSQTQVLEVHGSPAQGLMAPTPSSLLKSLCLPGGGQALAWVVPKVFRACSCAAQRSEFSCSFRQRSLLSGLCICLSCPSQPGLAEIKVAHSL